jgi:hypothetical protein
METIFAITCSAHHNTLTQAQLYTTRGAARDALKQIANERRNRLGVSVIEDTTDRFSTLLGWEEVKTTWAIIELSISQYCCVVE